MTPARSEGSGGAATRLLVVDDHEVVRQGLVALLDRRAGLEVVAQAGTMAEAVAAARRLEPDVVIMDVRLPDGSGIEACRAIRARREQIRVIMLTSYPDEEAVLSAILAGAAGYLLKQVRSRDLVRGIQAVSRGESLLDPAVTERVGPSPRDLRRSQSSHLWHPRLRASSFPSPSARSDALPATETTADHRWQPRCWRTPSASAGAEQALTGTRCWGTTEGHGNCRPAFIRPGPSGFVPH